MARVVIFGGSGFVGRYVVQRLARAGHQLTIICRSPRRAHFLKPLGDVGQIVPLYGDITQPPTWQEAWQTQPEVVINLVGILEEKKAQRFEAVHHQGAEVLVREAKTKGVKRFIHLSALGGGESSPSAYARSKRQGEKAVLAQAPGATVLRSSLIFGREDRFFNRFAKMAHWLPVLPVLAGGRTRFQPIYVDDVAQAITTCVEDPKTSGQVYELGGPHVYNFKELLQLVCFYTRRHPWLVPVPDSLARLLAVMTQWLPWGEGGAPLTLDQLRLLQHDSVVSPEALGCAQLGLHPAALEAILPTYLT